MVLRTGAEFPDNGGNMRAVGGVNETSSGLGVTVLDAMEGICNFPEVVVQFLYGDAKSSRPSVRFSHVLV